MKSDQQVLKVMSAADLSADILGPQPIRKQAPAAFAQVVASQVNSRSEGRKKAPLASDYWGTSPWDNKDARLFLADIPAWDNHSHAGHLGLSTSRSFRGFMTQWSWAYIEARMPQEAFIKYRQVLLMGDLQAAKTLAAAHHIDRLIDESIEVLSYQTMGLAMRLACEALYGEFDNQERLEQLSIQARAKSPNYLWDRAYEITNMRKAIVMSGSMDRTHFSETLYKWCPYLDPLFYPFPVKEFSTRGAEQWEFQTLIQAGIHLYADRYKVGPVPTDFGDYCRVVEAIIQGMIHEGALAFKIISMYIRPLDFATVSQKEAARVFADMAKGNMQERRIIENYIARHVFQYIADGPRLPIHIHTGTTHSEPGAPLADLDILGLERCVFQDPRLSHQPFILAHAGCAVPGTGPVGLMLFKYGNVYTDISFLSYYSWSVGVEALVQLTECAPGHKVLFGTDGTVPEILLGSAFLTRKMVEEAIRTRVKRGTLMPADATRLVERIMYKNAEKLYGMDVDA